MNSTEHALFRSIEHGPLLVGDFPEAPTFPYRDLCLRETKDIEGGLNLNQKLGHLYECALAVLLQASPRFELLARNLQIQRDAHSTIGELDFLLRDLGNDGQLIHLELATKFYLAVLTEDGLTLPGPDARDNYFRKIKRLREHQLVVTRKYRDALPDLYRDESIVVRQLIYGCIFDPVTASSGSPVDAAVESKPEFASAEFLNPHCRRGRWLSIDQCAEHFSPETEFRLIPKALWPVPLEFLEGISLERWTPQASLDRCVMLRVNDGTVPYFITPRGYPHQRRV